MSAHPEEHWHDPQRPHAVAMQRGGAFRERRLHQFKEGERDALPGQPFAEFDYELLERPRPLRVPRAVSEEYGCALGHGAIMLDAAASR